jgi:hypothetical protein
MKRKKPPLSSQYFFAFSLSKDGGEGKSSAKIQVAT